MIKDYFDTIADESGADRKAPRTPKGVSIAPAETEVGLLERKARDAYIAELESQAAAVTDPAISREILARANRVRDALPICELFDRLRLISQAKDDLGNVSGLEGIQLRDGLDQSAQVLRDANPQPPLPPVRQELPIRLPARPNR